MYKFKIVLNSCGDKKKNLNTIGNLSRAFRSYFHQEDIVEKTKKKLYE